jgi:hypothetical protein
MRFNVDARKQSTKLLCHYSKEKDKQIEKSDSNGDEGSTDGAEANKKIKRIKIARKIFPNDVLRVQAADKEDAEVTVVNALDFPAPQLVNRVAEPAVASPVAMNSMGIIDLTEDYPPTPPPADLEPISVIGEISIFPAWHLDSLLDSKVFKRDKAARKQPYLDLLVAKDLALQGRATGQQSVHEGGFATVYKLMAGEQVECPLCLEVSKLQYLSHCV